MEIVENDPIPSSDVSKQEELIEITSPSSKKRTKLSPEELLQQFQSAQATIERLFKQLSDLNTGSHFNHEFHCQLLKHEKTEKELKRFQKACKKHHQKNDSAEESSIFKNSDEFPDKFTSLLAKLCEERFV